MGDFDETQLAQDALAISGPSGTGGEAFLYGAATYYGVFNEVSIDLSMDATGFKDERFMQLDIPRASLTAGITSNDVLFRSFDSTTYQVIGSGSSDLAWHSYTLRKQFQT